MSEATARSEVPSDGASIQAAACPACAAEPMHIFYSLDDAPTNSCILLPTEEEAKSYPTGAIRLGFCHRCGFVSNVAFETAKTEYSGRYEETQSFSGTFNKFHAALARRLIEKHNLYGKDVLEIGCGKGEFLMLLSELGGNRGIGIDPGVDIARISGEAAKRLTFIQDFYSEKYAGQKVDFLACKMTFEHIPNAAQFMADVRRGLGDQRNAAVFFQVPEVTRILRDCAFEDIYYEHCSYYSPGSLARLFRRSGFDVVDLSTEYGGQYLTIEAHPGSGGTHEPLPGEDDLAELQALVASFPERCGRKLDEWRSLLDRYRRQGKTVALWGSGSKAVAFVTTLGLTDHVAFVTDVNPYRHGYFLAKTAHPIVAPEELAARKPDVVIVMNAIYREEIARDLDKLGVRCEVLAL